PRISRIVRHPRWRPHPAEGNSENASPHQGPSASLLTSGAVSPQSPAGPLRGPAAWPLRAQQEKLHALYLADPALLRPRRPPPVRGVSREISRQSGTDGETASLFPEAARQPWRPSDDNRTKQHRGRARTRQNQASRILRTRPEKEGA